MRTDQKAGQDGICPTSIRRVPHPFAFFANEWVSSPWKCSEITVKPEPWGLF
jgi:hypothetical protein